MTIAQAISTLIAAIATVYFAPAMWRSEYRSLSVFQVAVWCAAVLACVLSFVGLR